MERSLLGEMERGLAISNITVDMKLSAAALSLRNFFHHSEPYFEVYLASRRLVVQEWADGERLCGAKAVCVLLTFELELEDPLERHMMHVHIQDTKDLSPLLYSDVQLHISEFLLPEAFYRLSSVRDAD